MLTLQSRLVANEGEIAAKIMDGEAILINVSTGMYHSMDGVGGFIWELIAAGHSLEQIVEAIVSHYDVDAEKAGQDVQHLATELVKENLVVSADGAAPPLSLEPPAEKQPYAAPALNTYRDMSDLLALDPPMPGLQQVPWEETKA